MLRGSIVALVTPMLPSGDIDWVSLAALVEYHICSLITILVIKLNK